MEPSPEVEIHTESIQGYTVFAFPPGTTLDAAGGDRLEAAFHQVPDLKLAAIDLANVRWVASSAIGKILHLADRIRTERGGRLCLLGLQPSVRYLFDAMSLQTVVDVLPGREALGAPEGAVTEPEGGSDDKEAGEESPEAGTTPP